MVYKLWTDAQLKRQLKSLGLSIKGKRDELIRRHKEYVLQYTAEMDAPQPRTAEQIARDVEDMTATMAAEPAQVEEVTAAHPGFVPLLSDVLQRKKARGASQQSQLDDPVLKVPPPVQKQQKAQTK